jgi:hypothetical protein
MTSPPFGSGFAQLVYENLARRLAEVLARAAHVRSGLAESQKLFVTHFAETPSNRFKFEWKKSYGTHECSRSARQELD